MLSYLCRVSVLINTLKSKNLIFRSDKFVFYSALNVFVILELTVSCKLYDFHIENLWISNNRIH